MKRIYFLIFTIVLVFTLGVLVGAEGLEVKDSNGNLYNATDYTFYLPSHIDPQRVRFSVTGDYEITIDGEKNSKILILNDTVLDLTPYKKVKGDETFYSLKIELDGNPIDIVFRFASSLPSVYIDTSIGANSIIDNTKKDEEAKITITNKDSIVEYSDKENTFSEIKLRGNTTTDYLKKPFQIKLSQKTNLFNMGNGKTWVLLANYLDQSLIRNSIMYQIAKVLGMDMSNFQSVDLFIDGKYYGVYLLCEKVQIGKDRVDIHDLEEENDALNTEYGEAKWVGSGAIIDETILTEYTYIEGVVNPSDITGGYLIELDNNYYKKELCYFSTENGNHYVIKSPEYASKEQVEYISVLFAEMEEAIMAENGYNSIGKHYSEYIDVDSFVYAYIIAELSRNYDAGSSSMYFYKDKDNGQEVSKIVKGPLWDCDNTLGNIHKNGASNPEGFWAKDRSIWRGLTAKEEFNKRVSEEFTRIYDIVFNMIDKGGFVENQVKMIGDSIYMERVRWGSDSYETWPLYSNGVHYDKWQDPSQVPIFNFVERYSDGIDKNERTVIGYLCEHMEKRLNFLAKEWDAKVSIRQRVLNEIDYDDLDSSQGSDLGSDDNINRTNNNKSTIIVLSVVCGILGCGLIGTSVALVIVIKKKSEKPL